MAYDVERALRDGVPEEEIARYLAKTRNYRFDEAVKAGVSHKEIIEYLGPQKSIELKPRAPAPVPAKKETLPSPLVQERPPVALTPPGLAKPVAPEPPREIKEPVASPPIDLSGFPKELIPSHEPVKPILEAPVAEAITQSTTPLLPEEEQKFRTWFTERARNTGTNPDPDNPEHYYDARGYWKEQISKGVTPTVTDHLTDTYKLPGHPTFSIESKYYKPGMKAGKWEGEKYIPIEGDSERAEQVSLAEQAKANAPQIGLPTRTPERRALEPVMQALGISKEGSSPIEMAKASNLMALSKATGGKISPLQIEPVYEEVMERIGFKQYPTPMELYPKLAIAAGILLSGGGSLALGAVKTGLGIVGYLGTKEVESLATQVLAGEKPKFLKGREVKEFFGPLKEPYATGAEVGELILPVTVAGRAAWSVRNWFRKQPSVKQGEILKLLEDKMKHGQTPEDIAKEWKDPNVIEAQWKDVAKRPPKGKEVLEPSAGPPGIPPPSPEPIGSTIPAAGTPPLRPTPPTLETVEPTGTTIPTGGPAIAPFPRPAAPVEVPPPIPPVGVGPVAPPPQPGPIEIPAPTAPVPQMMGIGQEMPVAAPERRPSPAEAEFLAKIKVLQGNTDRLIQEGGYKVAKQQPKSPKGEQTLLKRGYKPMLWDETTGELQVNVLGVWVKEPAKPIEEVVSAPPEARIAPEPEEVPKGYFPAEQWWEKTPQEREEAWQGMYARYEALKVEAKPTLDKLKEEYKSLKGKGSQILKKAIKDKIDTLEGSYETIPAQAESNFVDENIKHKEAVETEARKAGVSEADFENFITDYDLATSNERPYYETNYNKTNRQIFNELLDGYGISPLPEPLQPLPEKSKGPAEVKKAREKALLHEMATRDVEAAAKLPPEEFPILKGKQPWMMTRREFVDFSIDPKNPDGTLDKKTAMSLHKYEVQDALKKGKPVPPGVLADYPDLQTSATLAVPPTSQHLELMPEEYPDIEAAAIKQGGKIYKDHTHISIALENNLDPEKAIPGFVTKQGEFIEQYPGERPGLKKPVEELKTLGYDDKQIERMKFDVANEIVDTQTPASGVSISQNGDVVKIIKGREENWATFTPSELGYQARELSGLKKGYFIAQQSPDRFDIVESEAGSTKALVTKTEKGKWQFQPEVPKIGKDFEQFKPTGKSFDTPQEAALEFNRYKDIIDEPEAVRLEEYKEFGRPEVHRNAVINAVNREESPEGLKDYPELVKAPAKATVAPIAPTLPPGVATTESLPPKETAIAGKGNAPLIGTYGAEGAKAEEEGGSRAADRVFGRDLRRFAKELQKELGWEEDPKHKPSSINIAPIGGDGAILMWKPNSQFGLYVSVPVQRMENDSLKVQGMGIPHGEIMWRWTTKKNPWSGLQNQPNQWLKKDVTPKEIADLVRSQDAQVTGKPGGKAVPEAAAPAPLPPGTVPAALEWIAPAKGEATKLPPGYPKITKAEDYWKKTPDDIQAEDEAINGDDGYWNRAKKERDELMDFYAKELKNPLRPNPPKFYNDLIDRLKKEQGKFGRDPFDKEQEKFFDLVVDLAKQNGVSDDAIPELREAVDEVIGNAGTKEIGDQVDDIIKAFLKDQRDLEKEAKVAPAPAESEEKPKEAVVPTEPEKREPVTIGRFTVVPKTTWRVKYPSGVETGFTFENDAREAAKARGGEVISKDVWSVGRYIEGGWNGRQLNTKQEAIDMANKWDAKDKADQAIIDEQRAKAAPPGIAAPEEKPAAKVPTTGDRWFISDETGKLELHFTKDKFDKLPDTLKRDIRAYFLWAPSRKAWVSKAKSARNLYQPKRIAGLLEKEGVFQKAPEEKTPTEKMMETSQKLREGMMPGQPPGMAPIEEKPEDRFKITDKEADKAYYDLGVKHAQTGQKYSPPMVGEEVYKQGYYSGEGMAPIGAIESPGLKKVIKPEAPLSTQIRDLTLKRVAPYLTSINPDENMLITIEKAAEEAMGEAQVNIIDAGKTFTDDQVDYINSFDPAKFAKTVLDYAKRNGLVKGVASEVTPPGMAPVPEPKAESPYKGTTYGKNYNTLSKLFEKWGLGRPEDFRGYQKLKAGEYMDLNVEYLRNDEDGNPILALSHNYEQQGDLVPDPDMEIRILKDGAIEALTFQDYRGYSEVYPEPGKVNPKLKKDLNSFLGTWLKNIGEQGHAVEVPGKVEPAISITKETSGIYKGGYRATVTEGPREGVVGFGNTREQAKAEVLREMPKPEAPQKGFAAEMQTPDGKWGRNALVFATKEEAEGYGNDLFGRWMGAKDRRVIPVDEAPNYTFKGGELEKIEAPAKEGIPDEIREAIDKGAKDGWVGNLIKEREVKNIIGKYVSDPTEVDRIFESAKNQVMTTPDQKAASDRIKLREALRKTGVADQWIENRGVTFKVMQDDQGFYLRTEDGGKRIDYPDHFTDREEVIGQAVDIAWPSSKEPNIDWDRVMQTKNLAKGNGKQSLISALAQAEKDDWEGALGYLKNAESELFMEQPALSEVIAEELDKSEHPEKLAAALKEKEAFEDTPPDADSYTPENWPHAWNWLQNEGWSLTKPVKGLVTPTIVAPDGETYSQLAGEMDVKNPAAAAPVILNRGLRAQWLQRIAERKRQEVVEKALDISLKERIVEEGKEAISGEPRRDEDLLERPVDLRPPGMVLGAPPETGGEAVPGRQRKAPSTVMRKGKAGVAEPAGEGEEGAKREPGRRRGVRRSDQPTVRKPGEEAAPGRVPTENERLATEPATIGPNDRNTRIEPTDILVPTGKISRVKANVNAIKLAKQLEKENRNPTPDERKILMQFTGWGGLGVEGFEPDVNVHYDQNKSGAIEDKYYASEAEKTAYRNWFNRIGKDLHPDLGGLMTPEQWAEARSSILNAFYTSREVIENGLWPIAQRLGVKGGTIVEPSAGIGHILGLIPEKLGGKAHIIAIEKDPLSGLILKKLYPQANVQVMGYEDVKGIQHNMADLVISNFPFGDFPVFDASNKDYSGWNIHNYFFARSVDAVKPGGLIIGITSHYTLDANDPKVRAYLTKKADLVGAIRLPSTAFEKNAGTSVTTDIIVLRKKDSTPFLDAQQFTNLKSVKAGEDEKGNPKAAWVNEYFVDHPDMVLGEHSLKGSMYGGKEEYSLKAKEGQAIDKALEKVLKNFPKNIAGEGSIKPPPSWEYAEKGMKEGLVTEKEGNIFRNEVGILKPWRSGTSKQYPVAKKYIKVRDAANDLIRLEMSPEGTEEDIAAARKELGRIYDDFVKKNGSLSAKVNRWLAEDAEYPLALSLERQDWKETEKVIDGVKQKSREKVYVKAPMFEKRANFPFIEPTHADSVEDAVKISMTYRNKVDAPYVAGLLGQTDVDQAKKDLVSKGLAFMNPDSGLMEIPEHYLSGNVRSKLTKAREAEKDDPIYQKNVEALVKVQPAPLTIDQIYFRLGSTWLPPATIDAFTKDLLKVDTHTEFRQLPDQSRWTLALRGEYYRYRDLPAEVTNVWGVERADALSLINDALNLEHTTIYDVWEDENRVEHRTLNREATDSARGMQARIEKEFQKWLKNNETWAPEVAEIYNREKNNSVLRTHAVPDLRYYPGASRLAELYPHQKRAVSRGIQESVLLDHAVGTGKTYIAATWAMEARRLNTARKPVIVVQNATTHQYARVFRELYPAGNVLLPTKKDFEKSNRKNFVAQVSTGNYDAIVMPHSMFDMIRVAPEKEAAYLQSQLAAYDHLISEMKAVDEDKRKIRQVEKEKEKREVRIRSLLATGREENVVYWEDLNVDGLFVDEAHRYKRSDFFTKMRQVKGIDRGAAGRSSRLLLKVQDIQDKTGGKNVTLATGTPISNTIAELWTMLRYVRPDLLEAYGVTDFDSFASTFGNTVINTEETPTGDFKQEERFVRYVNGPELLTMTRQGTDIVLPEDVDVRRPTIKTGGPIDLKLERPPELAEFIKWIKATRDEWNGLDGRTKMENSHVPLVLFGLAKKAAIDLRLVDYRHFPDLPTSKANRAVDEVFKRWEDQKGIRGVQLVFCDSFQSSDKKFNLFKDMRDKLIKKGVPAKEIAIIHDYDKEEQREELFEHVNNGLVRVLMGTTEKLGVGVNVQEHATTAHMIDVPYRPMDFEQRMGRLWRPGNPNDDIEIMVYGVKNTLDSTMYQRLQIKQQFINQFNRGSITDRSFEDPFDENQATFENMMAAFGNPKVREKFGLESNIRDLLSLKESHNAERGRAREKIRQNRDEVESKKGEKELFGQLVAYVKKAFPEGVMKAADTEAKGEGMKDKEAVIEKLTKASDAADKRMRDVIKTIPSQKDERGEWLDLSEAEKILGYGDDRAKWFPPTDITLNGLPVRVRVKLPYEQATIESKGTGLNKRMVFIMSYKGPQFHYWILPDLVKDKEYEPIWFHYSGGFEGEVNSPQGVFNSISSRIASIIETPADIQKAIDKNLRNNKSLEPILTKEFPEEAQLEEKRARLAEVERELEAAQNVDIGKKGDEAAMAERERLKEKFADLERQVYATHVDDEASEQPQVIDTVTGEARPDEKPVKERYFTAVPRRGGGAEWTEVKGTPVEIEGWEDYDFFVHHLTDKGKVIAWIVSEGRTGQKISESALKSAVKGDAKEVLDSVGKEQLDKSIQDALNKLEETSPRYGQEKIKKPGKEAKEEGPEKGKKKIPPVYSAIPFVLPFLMGNGEENKKRKYPLRPETPSYLPPGLGR